MYKKYAAIRDEQNLTDRKVAIRAGISPATMYDWRHRSENDEKACMRISTMQKVAEVLGVTIEAFL